MPLQVWLPLIDNLDNYGINNLVSAKVQTGVSQSSDGKLGKCYKNTGTTRSVATAVNFSADTFSLCAWVRIDSRNNNWCRAVGLYGSDSYMGLACEHTNGTGLGFHYYKTIDGTNTSVFDTYPITSDNGVWVHYVMCYDGTKYYIYKNGSLVTSANANRSNIRAEMNTLYLFGGTAGGYSSCSINDIRLYDHTLSPKEVKVISQGLVAHYPLNNPYVTDNLFVNGFGQDGLLGWSNSSYSTTEIPSGQPNIKASYTNNTTTDFLPISHDTTYTISEYIKATSGSTGSVYPSLLPYDVDKKFISNQNCLDGFNATYKTTLSQPLKKGDTVIHATDLSAWTTATTNYYYFVAIFGYKDSTGHVYADMTYTADSLSFGSRTDKSRIDKTNNTITLLSAYTGEDRPVGTTICQATEGSTYFYPYGGIPVTSIADWTFKTATVDPIAHNRLKWAKYIKYYAYPSSYHAGITLVDNNADKIVYDSSGYYNNGITYHYDTAGNILSSASTMRNTSSTYINAGDVQTHSTTGITYIYGKCVLTTPQYLTIAFWCKPLKGYTGQIGQGQFCTTSNAIGINAGTDYNTTAMHNRDQMIDMCTSTGVHKTVGITFTANEWHHYAIVYDGRYGIVYKDGTRTNSLDMGSVLSLASFTAVVIGYSHAGGVYRKNQSYFSDFRLYATPLSAEDIKKLYNTPESIANNGSVLTQGEFVEV